MAAIEQYWRAPVRGCELQTSRRGSVRTLHLGDDAGERAIAQSVFSHGQDIAVLAALGVEDRIGSKPDLLEPWRIEIERSERPEDLTLGFVGKTSGDSGGEERCAGIVVQRCGYRTNFMEPGAIKPVIGELGIDLDKLEGEYVAWDARGTCDPFAKRGQAGGGDPRRRDG